MSDSDELLLVRAAELYYEDNKTQDEIGSLLRVTRWKVGRLLARAREAGIVRIEIVHPRARRSSLERELCLRFGLADAVVVPIGDVRPGDTGDDSGESQTLELVARAAADYLAALRPVPRVLGISWGRTLDAVAGSLPDGWATGVDVVQVNGAVSSKKGEGTAAATAVQIAAKAGGRATLLSSPAILERRETRLAIEADRSVARVLAAAATASAYLFGAGVAGSDSILVESGFLTPDELATLVSRGAVGDVVGRYIDAAGAIVDSELDGRTVGLGLAALREASTSIAVIAGSAKHAVARAVVSSGLCTIIVTDERTALSLLEAP